jgi:hypothetical protein
MKEMKFDSESGVSNIYVSNESSCACLLWFKESTDWEPDFEALEN